MRKSAFVIFLLASIAIITSCKKSTKTTVDTFPPIYIPLDLDTLMPSRPFVLYFGGVPFLNVSGMLVASKLSGSLVDTGGYTHEHKRNWEAALFTSLVGVSLADAGTVSVNATVLDAPHGHFYANHDSAVVWNDSGLNHWAVSGSDSIPAFSVDLDGTFPSFTGTLPVSISSMSDFSFTFDSSNTTNGDSAYVVIYYAGSPVKSNVVSANGGTAIINASKLASATNEYLSLNWFYFIGEPVFFGGFIDIVIYNHSIRIFEGRRFAFVKQRQILGIVNFL